MDQEIKEKTLRDIMENASLFELHRISVALQHACEHPEKIKALRNRFQIGAIIHYYDKATNTLMKAQVLAKKQKYVSIQNCDDLSCWKIPYYLLQLDGGSSKLNGSEKKLDRESLSVGEWVGFNKDGEQIIGRIERLNQKTVTLITKDNRGWRVGYSHLYTVLEGEHHESANQVLLGKQLNN